MNSKKKLKPKLAKAAGALIASALILFGSVANSASATSTTNVAGSTGTALASNSANASPVVVTFDVPTAIVAGSSSNKRYFGVQLLNITTLLTNMATTNCGNLLTFTDAQNSLFSSCTVTYNQNAPGIEVVLTSEASFPAGDRFTLTIPSNFFTMQPSGGLDIQVDISQDQNPSSFASETTTLALGVASGGSSNNNPASSNNSQNTSVNTSSSESLASTGFNTFPYLAGGFVLICLGLVMIYARRKSNL